MGLVNCDVKVVAGPFLFRLTVSDINSVPANHQASKPTNTQQPDPSKGFSKEFGLAFVTVFLAELGDKTQLSTLLMTAESQSPWIIFLGAAAALITTSLFGVIIGQWLARRVSAATLNTVTGASLLFIAVLLIWDTVHL
ncbi:TMEM165/GDT1 family protein [Acaryochloris sp. 'Moss Beach']|uniref:TMEM165/GDT1 family protein n=1 Tax=Acaryochloris TaxID=155977 RepID=UPI001BAFB3C9|nr:MULTISPECIES: TMEM165/GDT1 family protein [Acaryochloris]QUY42445.1 TMEM165/GDT1 family protein [Acaryochloris marina S15]UJB71536.1 TMEM165/GDT1 family protein [Acaryochloris sp. 'Moss Beach']